MKFLKTLSVSLLLIFSVLFTPLVGSTVLAADPVVGVSYQTHVQNVGWQTTVVDGALSGTEGLSLRLEAIKVQLLNAPVGAKISYKVHVQNIGWQSYFSDSAVAGTSGLSLRLEAIQIKLEGMPGYSVQYQVHVQNVGWQDWKADDVVAGTSGQSLRLEAIRIKIVKLPETATTELAKITNTVVGTLPNGTANDLTAVENAMKLLATAVVSPNYNVAIEVGSTYSTATKLWVGKFVVTNKTLLTDTKTDADYRGIIITVATSTAGAVAKLVLIADSDVQILPFTTANTQAAVEAAMLVKANAHIADSAYTVTIAAGSTYSAVTKAWIGKFTVTENATPANTVTDAMYRTFLVTIGVDASIGAAAELAKITNVVVGTLPFATYVDQTAVETAMLILANAKMSAGYVATIESGSTYSTSTKLWVGKFTVTKTATTSDTKTDADYRGIVLAVAPNTALALTAANGLANPIPVAFGTVNTQAAVEAAMLKIANSNAASLYTFSIEAGSSYNVDAKVWIGKFRATDKVSPAITAVETSFSTITVTTATLANIGATAELAKITNVVVGTLPFATYVDQTAVETAMLILANAKMSSGYHVSIESGSTYSTTTKLWTGKFTVDTTTHSADTATDAYYRGIVIAVSANTTLAEAELLKITNATTALYTIPFGTVNSQAAVEAALLNNANALVSSTYYVTVAPGAAYSTLNKSWIGQFKVTNITTPANTFTGITRTFTVIFDVDMTAITAELAKITNAVVGTLPFGTTNTQSSSLSPLTIGVEAAMLTLANAKMSAGYAVTIEPLTATYNPGAMSWTGKFIVTQTSTSLTLKDLAFRTILLVIAPNLSGATTELAKVTDAVVGTLPFGTLNTKEGVEAAMLVKANNNVVTAGYVVSIAANSSYDSASKQWVGKFVVTDTANSANTATNVSFRILPIVISGS